MEKIIIPTTMLLLLSGCAQQQTGSKGLAWWVWLIIILMLIIIFWLLFRKKPEDEIKSSTKIPQNLSTKTDDLVVPAVKEVVESDDLKIIEGIGPKINSILKNAGVNTFSQLSELQPEKIMEILTDAGIRLADSTTWPEQARLAAHRKMGELQTYQDSLKGGRVV